MNRRNPILTAALCVSLVAHGMALSGLAWWYVAHTPSPKTDAINRFQVMVDQMAREQPKPAAAVPPPPPPPPQAKPKSPPPPPPKAERLEKPKAHKDDSGEANSAGTANRSTTGAQPMEANSGYEQADLMKDAKEFIDSAFAPASDGQAQGNNALPQKSPKAGSFVPDLLAQANPQNAAIKAVTPPPVKGPGPLPKLPEDPTPTQTTSGTNAPVANVPIAQLPTPKPIQKKIQGHRATLSDTESIAFAKQNSAVFHAGHLEGRKGLKVKTTTPRFGDASYQDMESLGGIRTVIQAKVDADGNVIDVQVYESSGSANIDQDCKLAVWNWILEPQKDKDGHPTDLNWMISFE